MGDKKLRAKIINFEKLKTGVFMKINFFLLLLAVFLIAELFVFLPTYGQIKIGDITVSEELAKDFFYYCETNPDTITIHLGYGGISQDEEYRFKELDRQSLTRRESHAPEGGGWVYAYSWVIPKKPTAENFAKWFMNRGKKHK